MTPGQLLKGTGLRVPELDQLIKCWSKKFEKYYGGFLFDDHYRPHLTIPNISLTAQDVTRWRMAWRAIQASKLDTTARRIDMYDLRHRQLINRRCEDRPYMFDIFENFSIALGFGAAAFMYGGFHVLAWFAHFDSSTEQLLWRIAACVVMGGAPIIFFLTKSFLSFLVIDGSFMPKTSAVREKILRKLCFGLWILVLLAYVIARAYLVIECFINLSNLPAGVYDVPSWSAYFPHIS